MGEFYADLRDIRFVLFEQLKVQELAETERYSEFDKDTMESILQEGYKFAREVIAPSNEEGDAVGAQFKDGKVFMPEVYRDVLKQWGENGYVALVENPEWGGMGAPLALMSALDETFVGANCALSLTPMLTIGAAHLVEEFGTDEMRKIYLEKMYSHEWAGTMCLTEPQAGSDVGAARTRAYKQEDGSYKIVGTKNFISSGDQQFTDNIIHMVLARTEGAPKGTKGLSLFLVPKYRVDSKGKILGSNDVVAANIEHKMGIHGSPTCTMNFGDNEQCIGWLLGTENKGMSLMFQMMNEARLYVGMQGLGLASAAYEKAVRYANERLQGPDINNFKDPEAPSAPIVKHPDVRRMLMDMKTFVDGMRSLFLTTSYYQDKVRVAKDEKEAFLYQGMVELLTPVIKAYGSDKGFETIITAIQSMGGYGYCTEYEVEGLARDCKIASIYEGANGIQALDLVGRKIGMKGGQYFMNYVFEINRVMKDAKKHPVLTQVAESVDDGKNRLAKLTMKLGKMVRQDLGGTLQWAVPYLHLFGHVAVGFELLKQGLVAYDKLQGVFAAKGAETDEAKAELIKTNSDAKFYNGKILEAKYFAATVLPQVPALEAQILSGDTSALEFPFEMEI